MSYLSANELTPLPADIVTVVRAPGSRRRMFEETFALVFDSNTIIM